MVSLDPWQSPAASARAPRAQLPRSRVHNFARWCVALFEKTSAAERPMSINFVVGAGFYRHALHLSGAQTVGTIAIHVAAIGALTAVLNLRRVGCRPLSASAHLRRIDAVDRVPRPCRLDRAALLAALQPVSGQSRGPASGGGFQPGT